MITARHVLLLSSLGLGSLLVSPTSFAQVPTPRVRTSPHETISAKIDGNRVTVVYGRPYTKDPKSGEPRKIWGALVPFDQVWRAGADEATLLITQTALDVGGVTVPAGAYTLFMRLSSDGSGQLIINRQIGQWGVDPYDAAQELARIPLTREALTTKVDQFTIYLSKDAEKPDVGVLNLAWDDTRFFVAYRVKKS